MKVIISLSHVQKCSAGWNPRGGKTSLFLMTLFAVTLVSLVIQFRLFVLTSLVIIESAEIQDSYFAVPAVAKSSSKTDQSAVSSSSLWKSDNEQEEDADTTTHNNNDVVDYSINNQGGELWIQVQSWAEGLTAWTLSVSELAIAIKTLNATLVEPDITNGRLVPVGKMRLSDVFNRTSMEDFLQPNGYAGRKEFEKRMKQLENDKVPVSTFDMCLNRCHGGAICKGRGKMPCTVRVGDRNEERKLPSVFHGETSTDLNQAIEAAASGQTVVLKVHGYWKHSLSYMTDGDGRKLLDQDLVRKLHARSWKFVENLHQMADSILKQNGVFNDNYAAIHWRAELPNIDYLECARAIVAVKEEMKLSTNTTVFLMSSLMSDPEMQWGSSLAMARNCSAMEALHLLVDQNKFRKVDSIINDLKLPDTIIFVALDLIIASRAKEFSTCTKGCDNNYCASCNRLGHFAAHAVRTRKVGGKRSSNCWKLPPSFVPSPGEAKQQD
jgi:hypothetical protein